MEDSVHKYIDQLSEQEKLILKIEQDHLGSSFNIKKSIGYIQWINNQK